MQSTRRTMTANWLDFADYFADVARQYERLVTAAPNLPDVATRSHEPPAD